MDYFIKALKQYADFNGKASRQEYWMFVLFYIIFAAAVSILDRFLGLEGAYGAGLLGSIYGVILLIPSLSAAVRRLHDRGNSGWWILIGLLPVIGWIWLIVLLATKK